MSRPLFIYCGTHPPQIFNYRPNSFTGDGNLGSVLEHVLTILGNEIANHICPDENAVSRGMSYVLCVVKSGQMRGTPTNTLVFFEFLVNIVSASCQEEKVGKEHGWFCWLKLWQHKRTCVVQRLCKDIGLFSTVSLFVSFCATCCAKSNKGRVGIVPHEFISMIHRVVITTHLQNELACSCRCT